MNPLVGAKVHFIGIGGIGMSGIAELLHNMGAKVSGSDQSENAQTEKLVKLGAQVFEGHAAENIQDVDVVVYSSAIKPTNVEYVKARELRIPLIGRAEALAEIMRLKRGVAIAGTHGKTTTTSLTAQIFLEAKWDPTIVVGGRLDVIKSNAKLGAGDWLIAESDESDGSFLRLSPELAVITNLDSDHMDFYKSEENLENSFLQFADRIPFYGTVVACGDDERLRSVLSEFKKPCLFYGFNENNDFRLKGGPSNYEVFAGEDKVGEVEMPLPGRHNALNALAAMTVSFRAGIDWKESIPAIESFAGVDRRLQPKGTFEGCDHYDDYGHHPTEVRAVLSSLKEKYPDKNLHVMFQPHRFSRTQDCWDDFQKCFDDCEHLYLLDIYAAGEAPIDGVTSAKLLEGIGLQNKTLIPETDPTKIVDELIKQKAWSDGDIVLTLGAGSVSKIGDLLRERL